MRVVQVTRFGGPEVLVTSQAPDPVANENDEGEIDHVSTRPWAPRFLRIYGTAEVVERDGYVGQGTYAKGVPADEALDPGHPR
jgi:hypothetical protein